MVGDGSDAVEPVGARVSFIFAASAAEMDALVNNRARLRKNPETGDFFIGIGFETAYLHAIPIKSFDLTVCEAINLLLTT